jgi:hypothetical protein
MTQFETTLQPVFAELRKKSTSSLKKIAKDLISSEDQGATTSFVAVLTLLENERLTSEEYQAFEVYLHAPKCEHCNGQGEIDRDNSEGVAILQECIFCEGTGVEIE